jgi:hypothetical protein
MPDTTILVSLSTARLRRVHGETVRFTCPNCKGGACLFAVNGGLAAHDGCWWCDECETGGRYDQFTQAANGVRYKLRFAEQACPKH